MIETLSPKQKHSLTYSDGRLNIWEGAVRSGKSFSALLRFVEFALSPIVGDFAIIGKTEDALKRNVISELARLLGADVRYLAGRRELYILNRKCYVIGANDERSEGKIRGATFAATLVDEATTIPENFFKMLLSRLSVDGAKLFATTNPDSPFHWLKKEYIDRAAELDLKRFQFVLDDNPSLTDFYKENLKKEYTGLWYKRFILGQWVLAEGAVYDFFDIDIHGITTLGQRADYYVVGVDYGTTNPCSFLMCGCNTSRYPRMTIEKEYYWNSKEQLRQKTDSEYCDDLLNFCNDYNVKNIIIDPSAASFIAECRKRGISNIIPANNDVLDGIRFVSQLLTHGTLKIYSHCENLIREMETYVWDDSAALRGIEKPKKVNDHCFIADTVVTSERGKIPISDVHLGDKLLTTNGFKPVINTFHRLATVKDYNILNKTITCTPEHKFFTINDGWKQIDDLTQSDILLTLKPQSHTKFAHTKNDNFIIIDDSERTEEVYNVTVAFQHEYFAENILVANCVDALRYISMNFYNSGFNPTTPEELNDRYLKAIGAQQQFPHFFRDGLY